MVTEIGKAEADTGENYRLDPIVTFAPHHDVYVYPHTAQNVAGVFVISQLKRLTYRSSCRSQQRITSMSANGVFPNMRRRSAPRTAARRETGPQSPRQPVDRDLDRTLHHRDPGAQVDQEGDMHEPPQPPGEAAAEPNAGKIGDGGLAADRRHRTQVAVSSSQHVSLLLGDGGKSGKRPTIRPVIGTVSPIAKTPEKPGTERFGSTTMRPAASRSAPIQCPAAEAITPAVHSTARASIRLLPTSTPPTSRPLRDCSSTPRRRDPATTAWQRPKGFPGEPAGSGRRSDEHDASGRDRWS